MLHIKHLQQFSMRSILGTYLLTSVLLTGCPKSGPAPGEGENLNPQIEFVQGIKTLQKVDKKTGEIDYATALAYFQSAVNLQPDFANAAYNAGWTAEQMGDLDKSIDFFQKAYAAKPSRDFLYALTDLYTKNNQVDQAIALYQEYIQGHPGEKDVQYALMTAYTEAGMIQQSLDLATELLLNDKMDITVYRLMSRAFYKNNQYDMSLLCAEKATEMMLAQAQKEGKPEVKDPGILNNMGVTYLAMNDEPAAIGNFTEALAIDPKHIESNLNIGFIALNSGNYTYALERFDAVLSADASNTSAKLGKAIALRGTQDFDAAQKLYKEILKSNKDRVVYFNAATLEAKYNKDYKEAERLLLEYQAKNPQDTEVSKRIIELAVLQEQEAKRAAEEAARKKAEEERKKRNMEQMAKLKEQVAQLQSDYNAMSSCAAAVEAGAIEMGSMVLEQGNSVIQEEDIEMAGDVIPFIADMQNTLNELKSSCGMSAPEGSEPPESTPE